VHGGAALPRGGPTPVRRPIGPFLVSIPNWTELQVVEGKVTVGERFLTGGDEVQRPSHGVEQTDG
jgi:hypothetical protein